jgi:hypothetical protein
VEVLVTDHAFDAGEVGVGGGGGAGQHVLGVEDVQALVLHGAHVEVAHGDDHEALEIERQAEARLVPGHRRDERLHRMFGLVEITAPHIHLQQVVFARARCDALLAAHEIGGHHREQVAGLGEGIVPLGVVAPAVERTVFHPVAVGQQHRVA